MDFNVDFSGVDFTIYAPATMAPVLSMVELASVVKAGVPALLAVGTARDFGRVQQETIAWPSIWVVPLSETASPNKYANALVTSQRVEARFATLLAVRDIADRVGATALSAIEAIRPSLIVALAQHRPAGACSGCVHRAGRLVSGIDAEGSMLWQDDFVVTFDRRIPAPQEASA